MNAPSEGRCESRSARAPALYAGLVCAPVLALFGYWFGVADRYAVFLYDHLGAGAFDPITASRYWMAGLVAAAGVSLLAAIVHFVLGRLRADYRPPAFWLVWLGCVPPLLIGIPLIVMTVNAPTLPLGLALACAGATLAGLALGLWLAEGMARRPAERLWLLADGFGLMLPLLLVRAAEMPERGLTVSLSTAVLASVGSLVAAACWLALFTWARARRRREMPSAGALLAAGAAWAYLAMPLLHHLAFTPAGYAYISTASNFFAFNTWVQAATWALVSALALGASRLRRNVAPL